MVGGDDLKRKESDGGDFSSPASQDPIQSGGRSFTEEGVDKDSSPVGQIDSEKVYEEEEVGIVKVDEDESRVEITRELKLDEVSKGREDLSVEVGKNSDGSSSSSSSSDDEDVQKTQLVLDSPEVVGVSEAVENSVDSLVTAVVFEELVEPADDFQVPVVVSKELVEAADGSQLPSVVSEVVVETADDSQVRAAVLKEAMETPDETQVPTGVLQEVVYASEAAPVEKVYEDLGKPVLSELNNELKAADDRDLSLILPTNVSFGETSNVNPFISMDVEDNVLPPSDSPIAVTRNGVGHHPKIPDIKTHLMTRLHFCKLHYLFRELLGRAVADCLKYLQDQDRLLWEAFLLIAIQK